LGTDFFFNQKEDAQRAMFIDLLKSKMPDCDVKSSSLKLKELKKAQKNAVDSVKSKSEQLKGVKDVEVLTIDPEISRLNDEFLRLLEVDNSKQVAEINKANNEASQKYLDAKKQLNEDLQKIELSISATDNQISGLRTKISTVEASQFIEKDIIDSYNVHNTMVKTISEFKKLEYFETIESYAAKHFAVNPVLVENSKKISEFSESQFIASEKVNGACPLSGEMCETAKLHSVAADKLFFDNEKSAKIEALKSENRSILTKEMNECNAKYLAVKSELEKAEKEYNDLLEANQKTVKDNEFSKNAFESTKSTEIDTLKCDLNELEARKVEIAKQVEAKKSELAELAEPKIQKLPEDLEISGELIEAHSDFYLTSQEITKAIGVNENNIKLRAEYEKEIKALQSDLFTIGEQIAVLTAEISNYFSNLNGVVKSEFSGAIEIDVQLLELVITTGEYKDCFKITANGKVFPYECNGALQNNLKLQVLSTFQRLKNYSGITLMDNCEANTTDPINTCGMNCVLSFATTDKDLTIK
jgi:seryl-tRNA synthetase